MLWILWISLFNSHNNHRNMYFYYFSLTEEEAEARTDSISCLMSHEFWWQTLVLPHSASVMSMARPYIFPVLSVLQSLGSTLVFLNFCSFILSGFYNWMFYQSGTEIGLNSGPPPTPIKDFIGFIPHLFKCHSLGAAILIPQSKWKASHQRRSLNCALLFI